MTFTSLRPRALRGRRRGQRKTEGVMENTGGETEKGNSKEGGKVGLWKK